LENPLISVVICFLNPGEWLREAIESVLRQTCTDWELILVDDGTLDESTLSARSYAESFPGRVIYLEHANHANLGLTASRNKGIAHAKGKMIAFLDADDCWLVDKLSSQLEIFAAFPEAAIICEASRFWYSWEDPQMNDPIIEIGAAEGLYQPGTLNHLLYPLGDGQPPCPTGILVKKEALQRSGAFEETFKGEYQLYEDQAFLAKMYLNEKVYISTDCHNKYRKHSGSMCGAASNPVIYREVRRFFLDWLLIYLRDNDIKDASFEAMITAARE
jgi:glycosyltransferase involved in cell wall biosynthesis